MVALYISKILVRSNRYQHRELSMLPPPLAGEGWGGGELARVLLHGLPPCRPPPRRGGGGGGAGVLELARVLLHAPSLSLPRKRGRGMERARPLPVVIAGLDPA